MAVDMPTRVEADERAVEVDYPWATASRAVTALNEAVSTLGSQLEQRVEMVPTLADWEGSYRFDEFDPKYRSLEVTAGGLKESLTRLASSIVSGAELANEQQRINNADAEERQWALGPGPV
jgi:uncharacterized protein YukE